MPSQPYHVLLYYCYTPIDDPQAFRDEQYQYCLTHNLRGRIIVAKEGINGTISGLVEDCAGYMEMMRQDERFAGIDFKETPHADHAFAKLHVRVKEEIVNSGLPHIDPTKEGAPHIDTRTFQEMIKRDDVVVLDTRSDYEHRLGKFKNALTLDMQYFREFPEKVVEKLAPYKEKGFTTILSCTGGIRCEKVGAYLRQQGFDNVCQLQGGILRYAAETKGEDFEGTCYVFDNRYTTPINKKSPTVISSCYVCKVPSDHIVNCTNYVCNKHVTLCFPCAEKMEGACSPTCQRQPRKHPYTPRTLPRSQYIGNTTSST